MSALLAGWLTVLAVAFADVPAAIRLTVMAAVAQALFIAGWVLGRVEAGAAPVLLGGGVLLAAALAPLALLRGLKARPAGAVALLLPLGAAGLATAGAWPLAVAGIGLFGIAAVGVQAGGRRQAGWVGAAALGLASVASGLEVPQAGVLVAGVLGLAIAADGLLPAAPRGLGAMLLLPCLLPVAAAAGPVLLASLGLGLGLLGWGWLRPGGR